VTAATPLRPTRLRTLNAMLASLAGSGPQLRRDVDAVVRMFESDELSASGLDAHELAQAATQMLRLLATEHSLPSITVLDYRTDPFDPLWAADRMQSALASVADASDVLLWVVGLQDQFLHGQRSRSLKSRTAYDEAVEAINALAAKLTNHQRVTVVVL